MTVNCNLEELPDPFCFYRYVLKSDHLHFGLWAQEAPHLSIEAAQQRMFEHLLSFFPPPPAAVLDIGCGLGLSAALLAFQGYDVTAIAPSKELISYARQNYGHSRVNFQQLSFFDKDERIFAQERYDVAFFQESMQYLHPLKDVLGKTRRILKTNGLLIMGDEVCYDHTIQTQTAVHPARDFTTALSETGFRILENNDLGESVYPTCEFIIEEFGKNFDEIVSAFSQEDTKQKLRFYLNGWNNQKQWYSKRQMGYTTLVARKDNFYIRPYMTGDESNILSMFSDVFYVERSIEHWYWKFRDNPYGSHKIAEVFAVDGTLVAHFAAYPVPLYASNEEARSGIVYHAGDTMTRPSVRNTGRGKTSILARMANYFYATFCEGTVPFIYGFNTAVIRELGTRYLGYNYGDTVSLWKKDLSPPPFGTFGLFKRLLSGYTVEQVSLVTEEWDTFFERVSSLYTLLIRRDSKYLRWRYLNCPDKIHKVFSVRKNGRLVGWSVFTHNEDKIVWGDALFEAKHSQAARCLLRTVCEKEFPGCSTIEGWFSQHPPWWTNCLKEMGFVAMPEPNGLALAFVIFESASIKQTFHHCFYYTIGDSDLF